MIAALFVANIMYQVFRKPTELLTLLQSGFHKAPEETWDSYGRVFKEKSTYIMSPDLLAALAQAESNGNPLIRTYWKFKFTTKLDHVYAPASSAVGIFQITEGTFAEAKHFCIRGGQVLHEGEGRADNCWGNMIYSRLVPSHAIEMTSARLHFYTRQILGKMHSQKKAPTKFAGVIEVTNTGIEPVFQP